LKITQNKKKKQTKKPKLQLSKEKLEGALRHLSLKVWGLISAVQ